MFFASEIWCVADVSSTCPSSEQANAKNISYLPNPTGEKLTISTFVDLKPVLNLGLFNLLLSQSEFCKLPDTYPQWILESCVAENQSFLTEFHVQRREEVQRTVFSAAWPGNFSIWSHVDSWLDQTIHSHQRRTQAPRRLCKIYQINQWNWVRVSIAQSCCQYLQLEPSQLVQYPIHINA